MANNWKKIFKKLDQSPVEGPFSSDWEAMHGKIAAHPDLRPNQRKRGFWYGAGLAVLIGTVAFGTWVLWPQGNDSPEHDNSTTTENPARPQSLHKIDDETHVENSNSTLHEGQPSGSSEEASANKDIIADNPVQDISRGTENTAALNKKEGVEGPERDNASASEEHPSSGTTSTSAEKDGKELLPTASARADKAQEGTDPEERAPLSDSRSFAVERTHQDQIEIAPLPLSMIPARAQDSLVANVSTATSPDILDLTGKGFKITGLGLGAMFLSDFSSDFYALGQGVDIDVQRGSFLLNAGFYYYDLHTTRTFERIHYATRLDTSFILHTETRTGIEVDSTWVVFGPNQGGYVHDTTTFTVVDSTLETRIDTSTSKIRARENERIRLSYVEMPVTVGYRFHLKRFAIDVTGGAVIRKVTSRSLEDPELQTHYGVDVMLQPAVRYYFVPRYSVFAGAGLRYGVVSDGFLDNSVRYNLRLGVTYHF